MVAIIKLRVVDLYRGDRVSSFRKAADFGIWGIIHKATTGATGKDGKYSDRRSAALDAGLLWGAYHWGTNANVPKQVDNFLQNAKPDDKTLIALDYEDARMSLAQAREFLTLLAEKLGRKPVLYSGNLIKERLGNKTDAFFGSHRGGSQGAVDLINKSANGFSVEFDFLLDGQPYRIRRTLKHKGTSTAATQQVLKLNGSEWLPVAEIGRAHV